MAETQPPDRVTARMTVVTLPAEIDVINGPDLGQELQQAVASGVTTVVADMTATAFCDSGGVRVLVLAAERAAAGGAELRVVPSAAVLRVLTVMGIDGLLTVYPSLHEAMTAGPAAPTSAADSDGTYQGQHRQGLGHVGAGRTGAGNSAIPRSNRG